VHEWLLQALLEADKSRRLTLHNAVGDAAAPIEIVSVPSWDARVLPVMDNDGELQLRVAVALVAAPVEFSSVPSEQVPRGPIQDAPRQPWPRKGRGAPRRPGSVLAGWRASKALSNGTAETKETTPVLFKTPTNPTLRTTQSLRKTLIRGEDVGGGRNQDPTARRRRLAGQADRPPARSYRRFCRS
jgi:hypothetical protein